MAFKLLTDVATKALNKVGSAAGSAFNYLQKNAPQVIDRAFNGPQQRAGVPVIDANPFTQVGNFVKNNVLYDAQKQRLFPMSPYWGISDANAIQDPLERQRALNDASLNMLMGLTTGPESLSPKVPPPINFTPLKDTLFNQVDDVVKKLPRRPSTTMYSLPEGGLFKVSKQPKTTAKLDEITKQARDINPSSGNRTETLFLESGAPKYSLPQPQNSATLKQIQQLASQGDNMQGISFTAKNADEAREALRLGVPSKSITVQQPKTSTRTWFAGEEGVSKTMNPQKELTDIRSDQAINDAAADTFNVGNNFTRRVRDMFLDTKDNLKKTFGNLYDTSIAPTIDRHTDRMAEAADWGKGYYDRIQRLGVKVGSREDKLIRKFSQHGPEKGFDKVRSEVGDEKAIQLRNAYEELRKAYDEIIDFVNTRRAEYGMSQIPKKDDFLSQIGSGRKGLFDFNAEGGVHTVDEVSSAIFKKQEGAAKTGAIESMAQYIDYAKRAGFTDLTGKELSDLRTKMSAIKGIPSEALEQLKKVETNILGNKEVNPTLKTIENVAGRLRSAKIVGKASTLVSQTLSLPQAIVETGPINFIKGQFSSEAGRAIKSSKFLKAVGDKIPRALRTGNAYTKAVGLGGDALMEAQNATSRTIWKGFYQKARQMGMDATKAAKWADDEVPKIVGDRRLGMSPEVYNTFLGKFFGAFTQEPTAAITRLAKNIGQKKFGTVLGTLVAWHIGNELNEKYGTGYRPFVDPYEAVKDSLEFSSGSDTREENDLKAVTSILAEALQAMPILNNVFNTAYSVGEVSGILPDSQDVMGQDNTWMNVGSLYNPLGKWDRNITGNKAIDVPLNIASNTLPYFEQGARTAQAAGTLSRGYAQTKDGSPMYDAPDSPVDVVRSLLFGQSSTQNARDWFDNDYAGWLTDTQRKVFDKLPSKEQKTAYLEQIRGKNENLNRLRGKTKSIGDSSKDSSSTYNSESFLSAPTSKAEKEENRTIINEMLASGQIPSEKDILTGLFNGKTYDKSSRSEQRDILNEMLRVADDEYLTPEQKAKIANAANIDPRDLEYYRGASLDPETRLEAILEYSLTSKPEDRNEYIASLVMGKRSVAGKSMFSDKMFERLYDEGLITKDEKKLIAAVKWDPIFNRFYMDRDYEGSGGGLSKSEIKSYISKVNALYKDVMKRKTDTSLLKKLATDFPEVPTLNLSTKRGSSKTSTGRWFTEY